MQMTNENKTYLAYITKYMGIALIAGSVVHVGTLQVGFYRYIALGIIGLILMLAGNIYEAKQTGQKIDFKYLSIIVGLSFATGFLSGGVQHYLDNPAYAGYLISIGLFISYLTFFWKEHFVLKSKNIIVILIVSITLLLLSNLFLKKYTVDMHHFVEGTNANTASTNLDNAIPPHEH